MKLDFKSNYPDSLPNEFGEKNGTVYIYIDNKVYLLEEEKDVKNPIAIMVEPRSIFPEAYTWLEENYKRFKYIFTFDSRLLQLPNAKLLIYGQITAEFPHDVKNKAVSMVASNKDFCEGHRNRQYVANTLKGTIDTYGQFDGGGFCEDADYLKHYMFNVAMENYSDGHYFTEKICNCFASRTVPIYWGCPNIGQYFNMDGIIYCSTPDEAIEKAKEVLHDPKAEYNKRRIAIEDNYQRVQKYRRYADWFLTEYSELLENLI